MYSISDWQTLFNWRWAEENFRSGFNVTTVPFKLKFHQDDHAHQRRPTTDLQYLKGYVKAGSKPAMMYAALRGFRKLVNQKYFSLFFLSTCSSDVQMFQDSNGIRSRWQRWLWESWTRSRWNKSLFEWSSFRKINLWKKRFSNSKLNTNWNWSMERSKIG